MKTLKAVVITMLFAFVASTAFAAGSATLNVQANVLGTCSFASVATLLDFTDIDPTSGADATASTSINYSCTKGTVYSLTTPGTASISNGTDTISVNLTYTDPGTLTGSGVATTLAIDGTIPIANYATVSAGLYTGFITLQVSP